MSAWWIRNGITHERIRPGNPQENGRHERMHKTLKAEATIPAKADMKSQQAEFDRFVHEFDCERPHEALGMLTPAQVYRQSDRIFLDVKVVSYPCGFLTRNVRDNGCIKWRGREVFISEMLSGQTLGLSPICYNDIHVYDVYYSTLKIGRLDGDLCRFTKVRRA